MAFACIDFLSSARKYVSLIHIHRAWEMTGAWRMQSQNVSEFATWIVASQRTVVVKYSMQSIRRSSRQVRLVSDKKSSHCSISKRIDWIPASASRLFETKTLLLIESGGRINALQNTIRKGRHNDRMEGTP